MVTCPSSFVHLTPSASQDREEATICNIGQTSSSTGILILSFFFKKNPYYSATNPSKMTMCRPFLGCRFWFNRHCFWINIPSVSRFPSGREFGCKKKSQEEKEELPTWNYKMLSSTCNYFLCYLPVSYRLEKRKESCGIYKSPMPGSIWFSALFWIMKLPSHTTFRNIWSSKPQFLAFLGICGNLQALSLEDGWQTAVLSRPSLE